jgi:virginiamycin B lyase
LILEDLEGRRLLSQAVQSIVTLVGPDYPPSNVISGPDGDLWVGINPTVSSAAIDRIGLNGSVASFPVPDNLAHGAFFGIVSLTTGPDGNVWFDTASLATTGSQVVIGKMTPAGEVTEVPPIPLPAGETDVSRVIVSGPGGDLWFGYTVYDATHRLPNQNFIGQATTAGAVTLFPIPSFFATKPILGGVHASPVLDSLAAGADGNLWFTEGAGSDFIFGRMSPSGVVTQFPTGNMDLGSVANGPNGSIIVIGQKNHGLRSEVFRVSTAGAITRYKIPAAISNAFSAYLGPADGSLWFTDGESKIGRITASGVATSYNVFVGGRQHYVNSMAVGQDGNAYLFASVYGTRGYAPVVYRFSPRELAAMRGVRTPKSRG